MRDWLNYALAHTGDAGSWFAYDYGNAKYGGVCLGLGVIPAVLFLVGLVTGA